MQKIKKIVWGEQGPTGVSKSAKKSGFSAAQAHGWAQPKSFWVVPIGGLGVYKSTPKFWSRGSQGAVRSTFQFYYIGIDPKLGKGLPKPRGTRGHPTFGG